MTLDITLLGRFAVEVDGQPVPAESWRRRRASEVVKILALERDHRAHREQLMDEMWPSLDPAAAGANLRKAVHYARRALGSHDTIRNSNGIIELWSDGAVVVDAERFQRAARDALSSGEVGVATKAADLYTGELLPADRYAPWAHDPRERLRLLAVRVMKAAGLWQRVLEVDPADEEAHQAMMRRALEEGDRSGVIQQFERLRQRLRIDLGLGPSEESVALYERALVGEEAGTGTERVRTLLARSFVELNQGQLDLAQRDAQEAHRLAVADGLAMEFNEATALLSIISGLRGRWRDLFRSEFVEAVQNSEDVAERIFDAHVCVTEYNLLGPAGHEGLLAFAEELRDIATQAGSIRGQAVADLLAGEAHLFSGRPAEAEESLESAIALHSQTGASGGQVIAMQRLAECALVEGDPDRAISILNDGLVLARTSRLAPHLVSRMYEGLIRSSKGETAVAAMRTGELELADEMICPPCAAGFRAWSAIALAENGDITDAQEHLVQADGVAAMWPDGYWHAVLLEARGAVQRASGAALESADLYRAAAERYAGLDRPIDRTRCLGVAESLMATTSA